MRVGKHQAGVSHQVVGRRRSVAEQFLDHRVGPRHEEIPVDKQRYNLFVRVDKPLSEAHARAVRVENDGYVGRVAGTGEVGARPRQQRARHHANVWSVEPVTESERNFTVEVLGDH